MRPGAFRRIIAPKGDLARMTGNLVSADDFTTGWSVGAATVTANAAVAPDGNQTADLVVSSNLNNSQHRCYYNFNITTANIQYTARLRIKAAGFNYVELLFGNNGGYAKYFGAVFNVQNCTVCNTRGATYIGSPRIKRLNNNWRLIEIPFTPAFDANATHSFEINIMRDNWAIGTSWFGDDTGGVYVWGAELAPTAQ